MSTQTRQEASSHTGKDNEQSMVDEVKEKGQEIGREAKHELEDVVSQLKEKSRNEADTQARRTAETIRGWSKQMHSMAESSTETGRAVDLASAGATQIDRIADRLENDGLEGIIGDIEGFARRRPGLFIAAGVGVGVALGRLFRAVDTSDLKDAVTDGPSDSGTDRSRGNGQSFDTGNSRSRASGERSDSDKDHSRGAGQPTAPGRGTATEPADRGYAMGEAGL